MPSADRPSEHSVHGCRLRRTWTEPFQTGEGLERALEDRSDRLQLGRGPLEAGEARDAREIVERDGHAREDTRSGRRQARPLALQSVDVAVALTVIDPG